MEMNVEIQQRVAERVLHALENEKLMNKEAAEIFGFSPIYLSFIKRRTEFHKTPRKAWEVMHDWSQTGETLKSFKSPLKAAAELTEAEQPDTIVIPRGGDKVDLSKINLRTGTTIFTVEVTENEIIIRFPLVRKEENK